MRIGGIRLNWLRRRWWVIALCVVVVTAAAYAVARPAGGAYTSEALLIVRSGATANTPGSANEANRLAVTYSQLIPQDSLVLERVAERLGVERSTVEDNVAVEHDPNTSILRLRYSAPTEEAAVEGARAFADALTGSSPASTNFNGLGLSRLPDDATRNEGSSSTLPVGILLGLCLGVVLVLAWERADGRLDSIEDLEQEVDYPVTGLKDLSGGAILALMERWRSIAGDRPASVAIVGSATGYQSLTAEVAVVFANTAAADTVTEGTGASVTMKGMRLLSGGAPGTSEVGESIVQRAGATVLVIPQGSQVNDLRKVMESLNDFEVKPVWALFASSSVVARGKRHYGAGEPLVVEVNAAGPTLAR